MKIRDLAKKVIIDKQELTPAEREEFLRWFELNEPDSDMKIYSEDWINRSGTWYVEDLTSQIDGITSHFTLSRIAKDKVIVTCNLMQVPGAIVMDAAMNAFTLAFTPTTRDKLTAEYTT